MNIELAQRVTEAAIMAATSFTGFAVAFVAVAVAVVALARS